MKIAMTNVFVNDPVKAHAYYTEVLGFQSRMFVPDAQLAIVVSPEDPQGTGLLLEPSDNPIGKNYQQAVYNAGLPAIVMGVSDVQQEFERLKARGVRFTQEPTRMDWGTVATFDDTCGNLIQIAQM